MGLDLSMTRSGATIPGGATYSIKARAKDDTRLIEIEDQLIYYMDLVRPTICVIEQIPPVSFNVNIAITLATVHALARKELARRRIPMVYILPKLLKKYATGSGSS